jgi:amidase
VSRTTEIRTTSYSYVFSPYPEPIARVRPGDVLEIYTEDAFESRVQSIDDLPSKVLDFPKVNPQTGPIYVEGAQKGDVLLVEILEIEPTRDFVVSAFIPYFGGLTATDMPRGIRVPYEPFLGTLATAPEIEAISTLVPGPFGGNMDVADVCPGNVVRLPVSVEGAYLYTGDAHAAQGDGELCGVACEMTARVRVRVELEKGKTIAWPRIESPTELMAVGSARPMEDAARIAWVELIRWLAAEYGFEPLEAYQLLTQGGRMRVGNMVDPQYSLVAKIDKRYVEAAPAEA